MKSSTKESDWELLVDDDLIESGSAPCKNRCSSAEPPSWKAFRAGCFFAKSWASLMSGWMNLAWAYITRQFQTRAATTSFLITSGEDAPYSYPHMSNGPGEKYALQKSTKLKAGRFPLPNFDPFMVAMNHSSPKNQLFNRMCLPCMVILVFTQTVMNSIPTFTF